jgi:hypothetical protein|tara:strand:+ start:606 stop:1001 length:396 start_codon:yes stop_codon:yes gene_type:complete
MMRNENHKSPTGIARLGLRDTERTTTTGKKMDHFDTEITCEEFYCDEDRLAWEERTLFFEEKEKEMSLEKRSQKTKEDWIKIINHLKAKGFRGIKAEKEAARCLKEIEKNDLKKAHKEYTDNLDKLKNLWS